MSTQSVSTEITCAAEVFIATALLHQEQPKRSDFAIKEIVSRAAREDIAGGMRPGVSVHASQHCVANRPPNPARNRMLFATGTRTRRLLLPSDEIHPERTGKIFPEPGDIPTKYLPLLAWAKKRYDDHAIGEGSGHSAGSSGPGNKQNTGMQKPERWLESLFELEGLGKEHWKNVDPDEFVRHLREGWE